MTRLRGGTIPVLLASLPPLLVGCSSHARPGDSYISHARSEASTAACSADWPTVRVGDPSVRPVLLNRSAVAVGSRVLLAGHIRESVTSPGVPLHEARLESLAGEAIQI